MYLTIFPGATVTISPLRLFASQHDRAGVYDCVHT